MLANVLRQKENIMKRRTLPVILVLLLFSSHTPLAFAQQASSNDWTVVQQIRTDQKILVKQQNGKEVKGSMIEATETTLTIDRDGKPFGIPRADVRQVYVLEGKAQKGKWALIGAGVGAGVGGAIGYAKYSPDRDDSEIWFPVGLMFGTAGGAVSGLLFGMSTRKRVMVFDAR
jgi:hypothetical protein